MSVRTSGRREDGAAHSNPNPQPRLLTQPPAVGDHAWATIVHDSLSPQTAALATSTTARSPGRHTSRGPCMWRP